METDAGGATENEERRGYSRRPASWQAGLIYQSSKDATPIFGTIIDVCRVGVAFVSDVPVIEKSRVVVAIRLPSEDPRKPPIEVQAEALVTSSILTRAGFRSGLHLRKFMLGQDEFLKRCP